jgi:elongation factor Ts
MKMAAITASMVAELRAKTDAPMMECKKALTEADGDIGKAEEILRVKLGNKATKAATRIAAEGIVGISISADGKLGSIIEVNCETDFVAKNDDFLALVKGCAELVAAKNPADVAALSALPMGEGTVESTRSALVGKVGENMSLRRFVRIEAKGKLVSYIHGGSPRSAYCWIWLVVMKQLGKDHRDAYRGFQAKVAGCLRRFPGSA